MNRYGILISYNNLANQQALAQLLPFSNEEFTKELGGSFPSLQLTVRHLVESDYLWLNRWLGQPVSLMPTDWDMTSASSIQAIWEPIQRRVQLRIDEMLADDDNQIIRFTTKKGATYSLPLWQTINHVVNHGTYHRGQITNMVRMVGHKPISTDLFAFFDEMNHPL